MLKTLKYQYSALLWVIFILIMCLMPTQSESKSLPLFEGFDKLVHTGLFFVLTVLLFYGKAQQQLSYQCGLLTLVKMILLTAILGGGIELLQWKVFTYRSGEWWDLFSDMVGVGMSIFSYICLTTASPRPSPSEREINCIKR